MDVLITKHKFLELQKASSGKSQLVLKVHGEDIYDGEGGKVMGCEAT